MKIKGKVSDDDYWEWLGLTHDGYAGLWSFRKNDLFSVFKKLRIVLLVK